MKALTTGEARQWCKASELKVDKHDILTYKPKRYQFFIRAPEEHRRIVVLARSILHCRGEGAFTGGMLWLQRWDIGSPQLTHPGWLILESIRRANGDMRSLERAPAQAFREDELVACHVFLIQTIAYGWVADFVSATDFFFHFKSNRQICCVTRSERSLKELKTIFREWNPTDQDPMVVKLAAMEKLFSKKRRISKLS